LNRGEQVLPDVYYFRTAAQFEAPVSSPYEWLDRAVFMATVERELGDDYRSSDQCIEMPDCDARHSVAWCSPL
jgi:Protein of unknown function (DUF3237)